MSRTQAESFIRNIIREIVQECAVRGHAVSDTLVTFMVKAVVLDPRNGFNVDRTLTKQDVLKIKMICVDKLMEKCSPFLDTIKMQVYFDLNYSSRREFLEEIHRAAGSRLSQVSREITDSRVKTREELDALYSKIITYILLCSSMGSPTHVTSVQEAKAALQSVFPQTELGTFMVLLKKDKEQQLSELTMIVTGIQLFTKASKKGSKDTKLMPDLLKETHPVICKRIEKELSVSQSLASKYEAVLDKLTHSDNHPEECDLPIILLQQALFNVRQQEVFLKMLLADAQLCAKQADSLQMELSSHINLLKDTVQSKTAVPTTKVFPLFKVLSKVWLRLQDEAELLNILGNITLNLQPFLASQAKIFSEDYLDGLLKASEVKTEKQRAESADECIVPAEMKTREWLLSETTARCNDLIPQYSGVFGYTLLDRNGLLLPEVAEKAKVSPEYVQLLKLHKPFSCISPYTQMESTESSASKPASKCDTGTQTDIHPVEENIDSSYEWNEWQMRRKAIKLADLQSKVTHSSQTHMSHLRRENTSQTWPPKDATCQTRKDGGSNVPNPRCYLAGLRGQKGGHMCKINLTRAMDEK